MRDLLRASAEEVAGERARIATEGAGARLLALQGADGSWAGAAWNRGWDSTMPVEVDAGEGQPSRWNTLRALRVLNWYSARD